MQIPTEILLGLTTGATLWSAQYLYYFYKARINPAKFGSELHDFLHWSAINWGIIAVIMSIAMALYNANGNLYQVTFAGFNLGQFLKTLNLQIGTPQQLYSNWTWFPLTGASINVTWTKIISFISIPCLNINLQCGQYSLFELVVLNSIILNIILIVLSLFPYTAPIAVYMNNVNSFWLGAIGFTLFNIAFLYALWFIYKLITALIPIGVLTLPTRTTRFIGATIIGTYIILAIYTPIATGWFYQAVLPHVDIFYISKGCQFLGSFASCAINMASFNLFGFACGGCKTTGSIVGQIFWGLIGGNIWHAFMLIYADAILDVSILLVVIIMRGLIQVIDENADIIFQVGQH